MTPAASRTPGTSPLLGEANTTNAATDIAHRFRGMIASGQLGAGERLPTVRQAAADLGVAPGTAARAYKMLEQEGLVVARTGAGTRVAEGAGALPGGLVRRLRELVVAVDAADAAPDDVVNAFRAIWQASRSGTGD
ncbi:GntR family transcriptional regulator [Agromyces lapidis]|uniref:GntR family transcriptional regulator n=1 Tax=Agromyces lapidis TaxID=279574 RepID=A0ABV5SUV5_9MICO|nr:GntR family transcriptional regulator [Agromyces lapidis]